MAKPEVLIACSDLFMPSIMPELWRPKLHRVGYIKLIIDALAAICVSQANDAIAVALESGAGQSITLYLATDGDLPDTLVPHLQNVWEKLRGIALIDGTQSSLNSQHNLPVSDLAVDIYSFSWSAFHQHFTEGCYVDYIVEEFIPQITMPAVDALNADERHDLLEIGQLLDTLRKTIACDRPNDIRIFVSKLETLCAKLTPYLPDPNPPNPPQDALIERYCKIVGEDPELLSDYLTDIHKLHRSINTLTHATSSVRYKQWFLLPIRVIQVPGTRLPFEVDMHDNAMLQLWREHGGIKGDDEDLDKQWETAMVQPMLEMLARKSRDVSVKVVDGQTILSSQTYVHGECALVAHFANNHPEASPYPYIGLSTKYSCYPCHVFFTAYRRSSPKLDLYTRDVEAEAYTPFAFPELVDQALNTEVRRQMTTYAEAMLEAMWAQSKHEWEVFHDSDDDDDSAGDHEDADNGEESNDNGEEAADTNGEENDVTSTS